jgi:hypothetical protein
VKFFSDLYSPSTVGSWRFLRTARSLGGTEEVLEVIGQGFVELHERAARAVGKLRWADKTPENVLYTRQWDQLLGDRWLFVHVLRNPLDTLASINELGHFLSVPEDIVERVLHYRTFFEAGRRFGAAQPDRYRAVIYEELVTQPAAALEGLMDFLGEALEAGQLAFNDQPLERGLEDPKIDATSEIHSESVHRWPAALSVDEAELIWDLTADLWSQVDPDGRFVRPPPEPVGDSDWPPADQAAGHP